MVYKKRSLYIFTGPLYLSLLFPNTTDTGITSSIPKTGIGGKTLTYNKIIADSMWRRP